MLSHTLVHWCKGVLCMQPQTKLYRTPNLVKEAFRWKVMLWTRWPCSDRKVVKGCHSLSSFWRTIWSRRQTSCFSYKCIMFHQRQFNCNQSDLSDTSSLAKVWTYVYSITTVSSPDFLFFRCLLSVLTACNHHRRHINDLCFQLMSIKYPSRRRNINGATYFTMSLKQTEWVTAKRFCYHGLHIL